MSNDVSVNVLFFSYQMSTIKRLQFNPTPSDSKKAPFLCELWPIIFDCFTAAARLVMCQVLTRKEDFWFLERACLVRALMCQAVLWGIKNGGRATKILMNDFFSIPLHLAKKNFFFPGPPGGAALLGGGGQLKKFFFHQM